MHDAWHAGQPVVVDPPYVDYTTLPPYDGSVSYPTPPFYHSMWVDPNQGSSQGTSRQQGGEQSGDDQDAFGFVHYNIPFLEHEVQAIEKQVTKHKKGLWSPDEDQKLTHYVMNYGHGCWSSVPVNAGLERNGKSCRLRWINYLRPGLKRGAFSSQEDETILTLHGLLGNKLSLIRWTQISQYLSGMTDNEIKNYWHSHLKKRVTKSTHLQLQVPPKHDNITSNTTSTKPSSPCLNQSNISNFTSNSSVDMVQSVLPVSHISNLPKLIFADWINLDEFQLCNFDMSSDQTPSHDSNYQFSAIKDEWQHNKGSTESSENSKCLDSCSNENILHTQMTIDQTFEFNDGDFDIDSFMYM
ncbi:uncharacterized protein LOC143627043 [Bidens hawaiensis]|uniref:uncharacterized protein LOC143627043 n=1 Tax=Bidens hawaiensis TaxID=980011 RepID=UPI0040494514